MAKSKAKLSFPVTYLSKSGTSTLWELRPSSREQNYQHN